MWILYPALLQASLILSHYEDKNMTYWRSYTESRINVAQFTFELQQVRGLKVPSLLDTVFFLQFREGHLIFPNNPVEHVAGHLHLPVQEGDHFLLTIFEQTPSQTFRDAVFGLRSQENDIESLCESIVKFQVSKTQSKLQLIKSGIAPIKRIILFAFVAGLALVLYFISVGKVLNQPPDSPPLAPPSSPHLLRSCENPHHIELFQLIYENVRNDSRTIYFEVEKDCDYLVFQPELHEKRLFDCLRSLNMDPSEWYLNDTIPPELYFISGVGTRDRCLLPH